MKEEIDQKFYDIQKAFFSNKNGVEQEELLVSEGDIEIGPEPIV